MSQLSTYLEIYFPQLFNDGSLVLVGSRSGMGKTCLMLDLFKEVEKDACFISVEQDHFHIYQMLLSKISGIQYSRIWHNDIKKEQFTPAEFQSIISAKDEMSGWLYKNKDIATRPYDDFKKELEERVKKYPIVFIDKLQMFPMMTNWLQFDAEMHYLKQMALDHSCNIFISADLDSKVDSRLGNCPMTTDVKHCATAADYADVVLLLQRREFYDPQDKPGHAELILAKNRFGSCQTINLNFDKEIPMFTPFVTKD